MTTRIEGARVLITGASSGIGWATAEALASGGATVAVTARRRDRLEALVAGLAGKGHVAIPADLDDLEAAEAMATDAWDALGGLDVVVHNAAMPKRRVVTELTAAEVATTMRVNFDAPVRVTLATLPRMLAQGGGVQVYVSSLGGRLGIIHEAAYCASKFALCGWAEVLAIDLAATPVDVRLVLPGPIDTEIWDNPTSENPIYQGPKEPPSVVATAILEAIESDGFERYAPDMSAVVEWRNANLDTYIAATATMASLA